MCDQYISGTDCRGYCVEKCGGKNGLLCDNFMAECIDSPFDNCDPQNNGTDCVGFCTSDTDGMCMHLYNVSFPEICYIYIVVFIVKSDGCKHRLIMIIIIIMAIAGWL